jgi:methionyl-tRNA formyltransferase
MVASDRAQALRVVFFGTPAFAVPTLDALLASGHRVAAVVTQPDRPRGRGQKTTASPVKEIATSAKVPILQPASVKTPEFREELAALDADIGIVAAYGQILTQEVLATPRLGMINVHASLLPRYRGAAPVHRAIINGDTETGITIMRMVKALDAGPMLAAERRSIGQDETSEELERELAQAGARLLLRALDDLAAGRSHETPQSDEAASYAPRLTRDDGRIDWRWPAGRIHNLIRGLHPWPHAETFADGRRLILLRARPADPESTKQPGTILEASGERVRVATGRGTLDLLEIQTEGKRPMSVREFLAGHPLSPGTVLQPPA